VPSPDRARRIQLRRVLAECVRIGLTRSGFLLVAGIAVFLPIGFIEGFGLSAVDVDGLHGPSVAAVIVAVVVLAGTELVGEILYSGIVTRTAVDDRTGERHSTGQIARTLPYGRLILADILVALAVTVGVLLLIVPGLVLLGWFGLVGPIIEVERPRLLASFRRSRELIGHRFLRAGGLIIVAGLASEILGEVLQTGISDALGNTHLAETGAAAASGLLTAPLFALPVAVLYVELAGPPPADGGGEGSGSASVGVGAPPISSCMRR
jgi:hypothetical protein